MKYIFIFFGIFIISAVAGCGRHHDRTEALLAHAESIMEEYPDSAMAMLDTIDPTSLRDDRIRALYALLITQARYKVYIFETEDSLISTAVKYFERTDDKLHLMWAYYLNSIIDMNAFDLRKAQKLAVQANDIATERGEPFMIGRTHSQIAEVYDKSYHQTEAFPHHRMAIENFRKANKKIFQQYQEIELARAMSEANLHEETLALLDSINQNVSDLSQDFKCYLHQIYLRPLFDLKRIDEVIAKNNFINQSFNEVKYKDPGYYSASCLIVAECYLIKNRIDSTEHYLNLAKKYSDETREIQIYLRYLIEKKNGNFEEALNLYEQQFKEYNKRLVYSIDQNTPYAERDFYYEKSQAESLRSQRYTLIIIFMIIIITICATSTHFIMKERMKRRRLEIDEKMRQVQELSSQLNSKSALINKLSYDLNKHTSQLNSMSRVVNNQADILSRQSEMIDTLFSSQFDSLDKLCSEYFDKHDSDRMRPTLLRDVEKEIERMMSPESIARLESIIDQCMDGIVEKMRRQLPKLKESDFTFIIFVLAGFSPRTVCLFTGITLKNFYARRSRLISRIEESDAQDKAFFVQELHK